MATAGRLKVTPREYLQRERAAEERHQLVDGEVFAMAGASRAHNLIGLNLGSELRAQLKGRPCEVYATDMRVAVEARGLYTYPDVVVVCGEPRFLDAERDTLLNPTVLIEVLSPSSERFDRGRKFAQYRSLPSLREYVLVAQDECRVERYTRRGEEWVLTEFTRAEDGLNLESIGCAVPLREIYARVEFRAEEPSTGQEGA
jgi:Uma2 family endonuclease